MIGIAQAYSKTPNQLPPIFKYFKVALKYSLQYSSDILVLSMILSLTCACFGNMFRFCIYWSFTTYLVGAESNIYCASPCLLYFAGVKAKSIRHNIAADNDIYVTSAPLKLLSVLQRLASIYCFLGVTISWRQKQVLLKQYMYSSSQPQHCVVDFYSERGTIF